MILDREIPIPVSRDFASRFEIVNVDGDVIDTFNPVLDQSGTVAEVLKRVAVKNPEAHYRLEADLFGVLSLMSRRDAGVQFVDS